MSLLEALDAKTLYALIWHFYQRQEQKKSDIF